MASAANYRCQKCLQVGHWTYDCTGARKYGCLFFLLHEIRDREVPCELICSMLIITCPRYVQRDSRTTVMKRKTEISKESAKKAKKDESSSGDLGSFFVLRSESVV